MRWAFQVERTALDRRNLFDLLKHAGYEPVDNFGSEIMLRSEQLDSLASASDVWEHAKQLRNVLVNVTEIDSEFALGPIVELSTEPPRRHHFLEIESCVIKTTLGSVTLTVSPPEGLSAEQVDEWNRQQAEQAYQAKLQAQRALLEPAIREPRAAKLLKLLKRTSHTGESLYKMYELTEGHPSERKDFQTRLGISAVEFDRFNDAVHNPVVSGELARHAYEKKPKTPNPMSMSEAESFVMGIAQRWLASLGSGMFYATPERQDLKGYDASE